MLLEAGPLSGSCIMPPRAHDSTLVTQGDTWRSSPLPAAYRGDRRPVTVCHSAFVPPSCPHAGRLRERGLGRAPVVSGDRLTGDR